MGSEQGTLVSQVMVARMCLASDRASIITAVAVRWKVVFPQGGGECPWSVL